jgi:transcription elongation factor GreB
MSKAFMKDDDAGSDLDEGADRESAEDSDDDSEEGAALRSSKNYITGKGFGVLKTEVHQLLNVERPRVVEVVAWAASNGDRSENADYQYGKKRLREIDRRIRFLQKRIDRAEVVVPENQSGDRVLFGATVTVVDENESTREYKIVGIDETDGKLGKVSWISPIGKALLQSRVGDFVVLRTPKGEEELEVKKIEFKTIE